MHILTDLAIMVKSTEVPLRGKVLTQVSDKLYSYNPMLKIGRQLLWCTVYSRCCKKNAL